MPTKRASKKVQQKEPSVQDVANSIRLDFSALFKHIDDLGRLLIAKKKVRIFLRIAIAIFCVVSLALIRHQYDNQCLCGDEPHYTLMEYSLVHDGDFNLGNNYTNRDSDSFGQYPPNGLSPDFQVGPGQSKTPNYQYSLHGVGIPLLTLPGYLVGGAYGMRVVMIMMAVVVLYLAYYWSKFITKSIRYSFIASLGLFLSYLFYGLAGYVFPDIVMAGIIIASLFIISKSPHSLAWQAVLGFMLGFSVLIHYKMLIFAVVLSIVLSYITWKQNRKLPYLTIIPLLVFSAFLFYLTHKWFGLWNPSHVISDLPVGPRPLAIHKHISAILFDAGRGVIPNSPIFLLVFLGVPIWFLKDKKTLLMTLICIALPIGTFVIFTDWRGGASPAGRYSMNFLPVLVPAIALAVQYLKSAWQRAAVVAIFVSTALITIYFANIKLSWTGRTSHNSSPVFYNTSFAFDKFFPQFDLASTPVGRFDWVRIAFHYALLIGIMVYGYKLGERSLSKKQLSSR